MGRPERDMQRLIADLDANLSVVRDGWDVLDDRTILAAFYIPGFMTDLSTWKLTVGRDGVARQVVAVCRPADGTDRLEHFERRGGDVLVREVVHTVEEIGFRRFAAKYDCPLTDMETMHLAVRLADGSVHVVEAYGARHRALRGDADMKGFLRLWNLVHVCAGYKKQND